MAQKARGSQVPSRRPVLPLRVIENFYYISFIYLAASSVLVVGSSLLHAGSFSEVHGLSSYGVGA